METRHTIVGCFMALLIFLAADVSAQGDLAMPEEVRSVIVGIDVPDEIKNIVSGVGVAERVEEKINMPTKKNVTPYVCRNAEPIDGTSLIPIPNAGTITAYSLRISKHVTAYWKEYHAVEGVPIQTWGQYKRAVAYLNPQITDINRICKGYVIRLPSATNSKVVVDKEELQKLRMDVVQLGMQQADTQRSLANLRNDVTEAGAVISTLVGTIETLQKELAGQKQDVADTKQLVVDLTKKFDEQNVAKDQEITLLQAKLALAQKKVANRDFAITMLALVLFFAVIYVAYAKDKQCVSKTLPKIDNLSALMKPTKTAPDVAVPELVPQAVLDQIPSGYLPFIFDNGKGVLVEAVQVVTPCGTFSDASHLPTHISECQKCAERVPLAYDSLTPRGYMPYRHNNMVSAIKVVSAKTPCNIVVKLRNFQNHMESCTAEPCRFSYDEAV